MKKAILTVYTGSTHPGADKAYCNIESMIRAKFPDAVLRRAYTSESIRAKLDAQEVDIDSVETSLLKLADDNVDNIAVLPCMIFQNSACMEMMADFMIHGEKFPEGISLFRVLLDWTADYEMFANAFFEDVIPDDRNADDAVVLVAHSSSDQFAVLGMVLKQRDANIFIAALDELPEMSTLSEELRVAGIKKAYLVPLMIAAGRHVHFDIGETMSSAIRGAGINCCPVLQGLGENNRMASLLVSHII